MPDIQAQFAAAGRAFKSVLVDRDKLIDAVLTAVVAREHLLVVGPPGSAKSWAIDLTCRWLGGQTFSVLCNPYLTPDELFGPLKVSRLVNDDVRERNTTNRLPEADFVFADEVFRGSSSSLNCLLKAMNERQLDCGDGVMRAIPLRTLFGAANAWPDAESGVQLSALFDRFAVRRSVDYVRGAAAWRKVVFAPTPDRPPPLPPSPGLKGLDQATAASRTLAWAAEAEDCFEQVWRELRLAGVRPGDRRCVKTRLVVQAFAWLQGADRVRPEHLKVARHTLWDDPAEGPKLARSVIDPLVDPAGFKAGELERQADELLATYQQFAGSKGDREKKALAAAAALREVREQALQAGSPAALAVAARAAEHLKEIHRGVLA